MRIIKLTSKKDGLGWVSPGGKFVNHPYYLDNVFSIYTTDRARKEASKTVGKYHAYTYVKLPNRKSEVIVLIGFDRYGKYQSSSVNFGRGYFPKKVKESLYEQLIEWLIDDGWAVELQEGK